MDPARLDTNGLCDKAGAVSCDPNKDGHVPKADNFLTDGPPNDTARTHKGIGRREEFKHSESLLLSHRPQGLHCCSKTTDPKEPKGKSTRKRTGKEGPREIHQTNNQTTKHPHNKQQHNEQQHNNQQQHNKQSGSILDCAKVQLTSTTNRHFDKAERTSMAKYVSIQVIEPATSGRSTWSNPSWTSSPAFESELA